MKTVDSIINDILAKEGERYTNHPSDLGGPTKWGITLNTLSAYLRRQATIAELQALTRQQAYNIYLTDYVIAPGFADIQAIAPILAAELVDTGVNTGVSRACLWLQMGLNGMNKRGTLYPDIAEDSDIGPATMGALKKHLAARGIMGEIALARAVDSEQGHHYLSISRARPANEDFTFGWFANRIGV